MLAASSGPRTRGSAPHVRAGARWLAVSVRGSVESCGGGPVKPISIDRSKCPTTIGCDSTNEGRLPTSADRQKL